MENLVINKLFHFCIQGVNKVVDNICRISPDLLADVVSVSVLGCVCYYTGGEKKCQLGKQSRLKWYLQLQLADNPPSATLPISVLSLSHYLSTMHSYRV